MKNDPLLMIRTPSTFCDMLYLLYHLCLIKAKTGIAIINKTLLFGREIKRILELRSAKRLHLVNRKNNYSPTIHLAPILGWLQRLLDCNVVLSVGE